MAEEDVGGTSFIDSHSHLADEAFDSDRSDVIERARQAGADAIICIGSGSGAEDVLGAARASYSVATGNPGFIWFTAGVHPHDAAGFDEARDIDSIGEYLESGAVAVGECGLDFHYDNSPRDVQRSAFGAQLRFAGEKGVPVVVHARDAEDDMCAMVAEAGQGGVRGVMHCYTGSHRLASIAIEAGWFVSFAGIVTFRKWADDDLLRLVPEDRILAESDAPYLAPVPNRGKRNEPAWVIHTVAHLAAARGTTTAEMGRIVSRNARTLFKLA